MRKALILGAMAGAMALPAYAAETSTISPTVYLAAIFGALMGGALIGSLIS